MWILVCGNSCRRQDFALPSSEDVGERGQDFALPSSEDVPDLADRRILKQVQFCVPGLSPPCSSAGEYFVADFVFVKYKVNILGFDEVDDIIIADSKLREATEFTTGQLAAKNAGNATLNVRSAKLELDIFGTALNRGENNSILIRSGVGLNKAKFLKIHGDASGNGTYLPSGVKN